MSSPRYARTALGLDVPEQVQLQVFPAVAAYVGGDIVAGVLASGLHTRPELCLFIDIGTNGEIVLGRSGLADDGLLLGRPGL